MAVPTSGFGVVTEQELFVAIEATPGTVPASVGAPDLITEFKPSDTPMLFDDKSYQGSMADFYGEYQGPQIAGWSKAGQIYGDTFGYDLFSTLGDLTETGTEVGSDATTINHSAGYPAGTTGQITVSSGTSFSTGSYVQIGPSSGGNNAELVAYDHTASSSTTITLTGSTRFSHPNTDPVTLVTGPYTHVFALLAGSTGAWAGPAQPPSLCYTHLTGLPATDFARQYAYSCPSEVAITFNSEKLAVYTSKGVCLQSQIAGAPVQPVNANGAPAIPSWETTVGLGGPASGGTLFPGFDELGFTLGRKLKAQNTLRGSQAPYIIGRGEVSVSGKLSVMPAISEAVLLDLLANTQPQLESFTTNGLSGTSVVSMQVDIALAAIQKADLKQGDVFFGYDVPFKAPATSITGLSGPPGGTVMGACGRKSPIKITLINNWPSYAY